MLGKAHGSLLAANLPQRPRSLGLGNEKRFDYHICIYMLIFGFLRHFYSLDVSVSDIQLVSGNGSQALVPLDCPEFSEAKMKMVEIFSFWVEGVTQVKKKLW